MPRSSSPLTFLLFSLIFLLIHTSPIGTVNLTLNIEDSHSPSETRILVSVQKHKIRIAVFYFFDNASASVRKLLSEQVIPGAIAYYQATLKTIPSTEPLSFTDEKLQKCASTNIDVPQALRDGVNADLVLLFTAEEIPDATSVATALPCNYEKDSGRANLGRIRYNLVGTSEENYQDRVYLTYVTLHEMGHILGFSKNLFDSFLNPKTGQAFNPIKEITVNGQTVYVLDVEPLTSKLQKYFACPSLEGAYLENEADGLNSHFERRIFMNDVLTASTITDARVSEFFLSVLEGSGWYSVDYNMAEPFTWGKGQGCSFLNSKCVNSDKTPAFPAMFCMPLGNLGCSFDNLSYGYCGTLTEETNPALPSAFNYYGGNRIVNDKFADNCPYYAKHSQGICQDPANSPHYLTTEYFGSGSSCFTGTLADPSQQTPYCFKRTCVEITANKYQVVVEIGDQTVVCTKQESVSVPGYYGKFNCPEPTSYCKATEIKYCPRGCMGRGECINNKCRCYDGYSGSDCGIRAANTMKEGTLDYLANFPGFTLSDENKPKVKISLRIMSVIIGVGIIGVTVVVGLTVNKIRDLQKKSEARKTSKIEYKMSPSTTLKYMYESPNSNGISPEASKLEIATPEQAESPTNAATIRQEALRDYFAPPASQANVDKLAVLRGSR